MVKKVFALAPTEQWRPVGKPYQRSILHYFNKHLRRMIEFSTVRAASPIRSAPRCAEMLMKGKFKIGNHVNWNSEAGRVSGAIVRVHTRNFEINGYTHDASAATPQYE